jgi:4-methyl-5(b-hydroxyethyl)-thiazole monophosphate biosynthesis
VSSSALSRHFVGGAGVRRSVGPTYRRLGLAGFPFVSAPLTPRRVLVLVYETLAEFEIAVLLTALRGTPHTVTTVGLTGEPVTTTGGLRVLPDLAVAAVDPEAYDALVVPGGNAQRAMGDAGLLRLVRALDARGALLAAICGGPAVLGDAGVLAGRRFTASLGPEDAAWPGVDGRGTMLPERVVTDGHVLTSTGSSYLDFAEQVLRHLDGADEAPDLGYFREPSLA